MPGGATNVGAWAGMDQSWAMVADTQRLTLAPGITGTSVPTAPYAQLPAAGRKKYDAN